MKAIISYNHFQDIILNPDKHQDWNNIFKHHIDVELNMPIEQINQLETDTSSALFHFINSTGGKLCNSFSKAIDIEKNPSYILFENDLSDNNKGCLTINKTTLENPFKFSYSKCLEKNKIVDNNSTKGWKLIFNTTNYVSNSLIINDSYIFDNNEHINKLGSANIIELVDTILPIELDVDYHILINTSTSKYIKDYNNLNKFYNDFIHDLIDNLRKLRKYNINVEIVIGEGFHKRKLFTNFLNVTTDKGFKIFEKKTLSKVLDHNDITVETMFTRNNPIFGDSQFDEMKIRLKELRKLIINSLDWINSANYNNTRCFYYSNLNTAKPIAIKNRLFNISIQK